MEAHALLAAECDHWLALILQQQDAYYERFSGGPMLYEEANQTDPERHTSRVETIAAIGNLAAAIHATLAEHDIQWDYLAAYGRAPIWHKRPVIFFASGLIHIGPEIPAACPDCGGEWTEVIVQMLDGGKMAVKSPVCGAPASDPDGKTNPVPGATSSSAQQIDAALEKLRAAQTAYVEASEALVGLLATNNRMQVVVDRGAIWKNCVLGIMTPGGRPLVWLHPMSQFHVGNSGEV